MTTYDADVRPGDVVLGHDGQEWGVLAIARAPRLAVTLVRGEQQITGYPPPGTEVVILARADVPTGSDVEVAAVAALGGLGPELLEERWSR